MSRFRGHLAAGDGGRPGPRKGELLQPLMLGTVSTSLSDDVKDELGGIHLAWEMDFPLRFRATLEGAWGLT